LLAFRGFPFFIKFVVEWELLFLLINNYYILGFFFFFSIVLPSVLGLFRVFFIVLYGQPQEKIIKITDISIVESVVLLFITTLILCINVILVLC
jgi:NADH:ubiquinone oxidoreductase subunit 4 (subunit M)